MHGESWGNRDLFWLRGTAQVLNCGCCPARDADSSASWLAVQCWPDESRVVLPMVSRLLCETSLENLLAETLSSWG